MTKESFTFVTVTNVHILKLLKVEVFFQLIIMVWPFHFFHYLFYNICCKGVKVLFSRFVISHVMFVLSPVFVCLTCCHTFGLSLQYFAFVSRVSIVIAVVETIVFPFLSRVISSSCLLYRITGRTLLSFGLLALYMGCIVERFAYFKTFTEIHELV